ncbi:phosphoadenosine phosphosulfate reductase [Streptosporangium violaceochromogenes]|nr:phosphoadenosine phosphosulfate reductase [Streptosporangium violaceochromogenes]
MTVTDLDVTVRPRPTTLDLRELAESAGRFLRDAPAQQIVSWAAATFGDRLCLTSSMSDTLLIDLASRVKPGIDVLFIDTGYHFPETLGTRQAAAHVHDITVIDVHPSRTVAEQERDLGPRLFGRNPDLCCHLRKVEPLNRALTPYLAWISGIRRDETGTRTHIRPVEWDPRRRMIKINPLAHWTQADADAYAVEHNILINPLHHEGYPSIGCAPCTRPVDPGDDPRSGRWAGTGKTECGLHL